VRDSKKGSKELALRSIPPHTITSKRLKGGASRAPHQARKADLARRPAGLRSRDGRDDIFIPPRRPTGPSHEIVETATKYVVRVVFPGSLSLDGLRWEMTGDVLEVEYAAPGLHYFQDFLIPVLSAPRVSAQGCLFLFEFLK
jgi:hypothetical protein